MIVMANIDWEKLAQQEEGWKEESEGESFLPAYEQDEYTLAQSDDDDQGFGFGFGDGDDEEKEWDYGGGGDDDDGEFTQFDQDPEDFSFSYTQQEQIGYGDPDLGTTVGGQLTKLQKIVQLQTVPKEKLYTNKLKLDLNTYFSFDKTNHYAMLIQEVPRFWLKNSQALASTIYMIDQLNGSKLTADKLEDFSKQTGIRKEDLYRYYRLIEKYIK